MASTPGQAAADGAPLDYLACDPGRMPGCLADVGERIRTAREAARLEQRRVAEALGVTQTGVSSWEAGKRDPGVAGLIGVAEALGVPASSLLPAAHQGAAGEVPRSGDDALDTAIARVVAERNRLLGELAESRRAFALAMTPGALEGAAIIAEADARDAAHAEIARLRGELSKGRAIAFRPGMSHMLKLRALHELLDPSLKPPPGREELRVALASLTDRAEASQAITGDEADEYRKLTAKEGD